MAAFLYRLSCAGLLGAQAFFAAVAAQAAFRVDRAQAGDLVAFMLARLDAAALGLTALAVVCAVVAKDRRAALMPLLAGLCALASAALVTPQIHALRVSGKVGSPRFSQLHAASALLLAMEMLLLVVAVWRAPGRGR